MLNLILYILKRLKFEIDFVLNKLIYVRDYKNFTSWSNTSHNVAIFRSLPEFKYGFVFLYL